MRSGCLRALAAVAWLLFSGCSAQLSPGGDGPGTAGTAGAPAGGSSGSVGGNAGQPEAASTSGSSLRRLTVGQIHNSVSDLLGPEVVPRVALEPDSVVNGSTALAAASLSVSDGAISAFDKFARDAAQQAFATPAVRERLLGCAPENNAACLESFVKSFGRKAFRRPLTDAEVVAYVGLASNIVGETKDAWLAAEIVTTAFLESPDFLYRVELGKPAGQGPRVLGAYELASRLSFWLWDTTPDEQLLDAAEAGQLPKTLEAEAERMLRDPRARRTATATFLESMRLDGLERLDKNTTIFPRMSSTLGRAMKDEVERMFEAAAFDDGGSVLDLFDTPQAFVNQELAELYVVPAPPAGTFKRVAFPQGKRAGLIGTAGFLAQFAFVNRTSVTSRGKAIREHMLCTKVPQPPGDVDTTFPEPPSDKPRTMRERLKAHATNASCAACHKVMDPIGLGLEAFDGIGVLRQDDRGLPLDTTGELDGVPFQDGVTLAKAIRKHPELSRCFVRRLARHVAGREPADDADLQSLVASFDRAGGSYVSLVKAIVASPVFLTRVSPP